MSQYNNLLSIHHFIQLESQSFEIEEAKRRLRLRFFFCSYTRKELSVRKIHNNNHDKSM